MTVDRENEVYLGDGLYVSFNGHAFVLRTPREDGDHRVALEPPELRSFMKFVEIVATEMAQAIEADHE